MANFSYTAKSLDGEIKTGNSDAENIRELAQSLKGEGLVLVKANIKKEKKKSIFNFSFLSGKVSISEKMLMTRNLWIMVSTGLSLVKGFSILSAQSKSKKMKEALLDIGQEVSKGKTLSDAFKKYPDVFSELFQNMIKAGEESGTLEDVLKVLSLQLEKEKEMNSKIKNALIYPAILITTMLIVGVMLAIFVLPKMNTFFMSLHTKLPITTIIILGSGNFLLKYWYLFLIALIILIFVFLTLIRTKKGRFFIDTALLKIPFVSSLVKKSNSASLIRSLSSLLASGVPLIKCLEITSGTLSNFYFKQALYGASKKIEKGEKLFVSLKPYQNLFPYGAIEMIEIGEETGKTSLILKKLAEFYEEEVSNAAENLSVIIEPVLIVFIGATVGVFAVSIIGPLYSSLGSI
ncbi:MAG: type II secretion system F family protein [Candidatus Staskawiczbacteria bacterium]|nr:type II secretion system F family protein [Candidatus Staskawiczbacteria bacterium]